MMYSYNFLLRRTKLAKNLIFTTTTLRYTHNTPKQQTFTAYYPKKIHLPQLQPDALPKSNTSNQDSKKLEPTNDLFPEENYIQPTPGPDDRIIIAMSSGVDSSLCAALYASKYKNVHGIYMANWRQSSQCTERDWRDVQTVCKQLGISCERINLELEYWQNVFQPMIDGYAKGLTPNPDVGCNRYVKFGRLCEIMEERYGNEKGKWWLVTGHYARVMKKIVKEPSLAHENVDTNIVKQTPTPTNDADLKANEEYHLLRGLSTRKDQSYYLSTISPLILPHLLLPLGHQLKSQTRQLAQNYKLHTSQKPDLQGLCFVEPSNHSNFRDFLAEYIEPNPGNIVTTDGKVWGKHKGLWHATIGQKSSVLMPQGDPQYKGVWFVAKKNVAKNEIVIVRGHDNPLLFSQVVTLDTCEWVYEWEKIQQLKEEGAVSFQFSSLSKAILVKRITVLGNKQFGKQLKIELIEPVRAVAPGQQGVLYRGNQVLGSGMIVKTERSNNENNKEECVNSESKTE